MADTGVVVNCATGTASAAPLPAPDQSTLDAQRTTWAPILTAQQTSATNAQTIRGNVQTNLATLQQWLANNPNGAVLTAGQTKVLANILIGISKLLLEDTANTTGT